PAQSYSRGRDLTGRFRWLWSPAARVERHRSFRAQRATCWWVWVEEEAAGGGSSTASSGGRSTGNGGEGAPVGSGRGGEVCELREDEAELEVGCAWAEDVGNGGATVSSSSSELGWAATVF